jgi:hypothetical protein
MRQLGDLSIAEDHYLLPGAVGTPRSSRHDAPSLLSVGHAGYPGAIPTDVDRCPEWSIRRTAGSSSGGVPYSA